MKLATEKDTKRRMPLSWGECRGLYIVEKGDPRMFCFRCGKMIRVGQTCVQELKHKPWVGGMHYIRWHYPECDNW